MNICLSSGTIWVSLSVVALAGFLMGYLFNSIWGLLIRRHQHSNKRRKKADRKKTIRVGINRIIANQDVSVEDASLLKKDIKDFSVESYRVFPYNSLVDATQNFISQRLMNVDGLGEVYKGQMVDTNEVFIIRRIKECTHSSLEEFVDEVSLLSKANHPNLPKLIGYSVQYHSRLLVYEDVPGVSLENRLHNPICLDWRMRMKIALGVARALEYLQVTLNPKILHLHIEPANIWLDEQCTPKLSAFGLIRMFPSFNRVNCSYETIGSYNYGLHDSRLTNEVTIQTDIYGFGILLLEMITGRKGIFIKDGARQYLTEWAQPYLKDEGNPHDMVDPRLEGKFNNEELYEACNIAAACIMEQPSDRPLISELVTSMKHLAA